MTNTKKKLELIQDEDVKAVLYDLMHKRALWDKPVTGQHSEFKEMVKALQKGYEEQLKK